MIERVQAYLHTKALPDHQQIVVEPFTLYLHATDTSPDENYALLNMPLHPRAPFVLDQLRAVFIARQRTPTIKYLDAVAPDLEAMLLTSGLHRAQRWQVMVCTRDMLVPPVLPGDVEIITLSAESSLEEIREGLDVNALGFDPQAARATDAEAEQFRQTLVHSRAFILRYAGQPVSGGMFIDIHDRVTELAGITTLQPYRRRGLAGVVTAWMTQAAFDHGADLVFLIVANEPAGRVYARVGFQPCATLLELRAAGA